MTGRRGSCGSSSGWFADRLRLVRPRELPSVPIRFGFIPALWLALPSGRVWTPTAFRVSNTEAFSTFTLAGEPIVIRGPLAAFALALVIAVPSVPESAPPDPSTAADELEGLWKAKRRFGPDARGQLVIRRDGTTYSADMMGRLLPVRADAEELSFELPRGEGAFRGRLQDDGGIRGVWVPPGSPAMGGRASPVVLTSEGPDRWSGEVVPFEDTFTFYLLVRKRPDGSLGAILRNPERDFGALLGVERLVREGDVVKLLGKRRGETEEQEIVRGSYDAESDVLSLAFPMRGGTYDFRREDEQSDFYPRGLHPEPYAYQPPLSRDDGWETERVSQEEWWEFLDTRLTTDPPVEVGFRR